MADEQTSAEHIAYKLMTDLQESGQGRNFTVEQFLDFYAECLLAVKNPGGRGESHKSAPRR